MRIKIVLFAIFIIAICLRLFAWEGALTFTYDQARDAFSSISIFSGDPLKILGPSTDIPGVYHGSLYYYLLAPFYFFGKGNPYYPFFGLILINCLCVFLVYYLGKQLTKSVLGGFLSALFFAFSFEMTQYSRWLSNPSPAILFIILAYLGLWLWINNKPRGLILAMFAIGISAQFEFFLFYLLAIIPVVYLLFNKPKIPKLILVLSTIIFLLACITMIVAELKFNFMSTRAFLLFFSNDSTIQKQFSDILLTFINRLTNVFYYNIFGINASLAGFLGLIIILFGIKEAEKQKPVLFILVWLFSNLLIYLFGGPDAIFISIGLGIPTILLVTYYLLKIFQNNKSLFFIVIIVVLIGNLKLIIDNNSSGSGLFSIQTQMILRDELTVIDYTYKQAEGKPFSINTVTNPFYINTTWAYLYNWYGKQKYGYLPLWRGKSQIGYPGDGIFNNATPDVTIHYLIIEPLRGIPDYFPIWTKWVENDRSEVIETKNFNNFSVEKRKFIAPKEEPFDIPMEKFQKLPLR